MTDAFDKTYDSGGEKKSSGLEAGTRLGKYELRKLIGSGGMGVVWSAHDPDLDRLVAIKLLHHADASTELRTRLLREARAMARLKHPNVLTVYEVGTHGDRDFIAMELVDGIDLDRYIAQNPPQEYLWQALLAAGRGLAAAHAAGLVHRDFKPHNVLRSNDGRVLVTDFGLARGVAEPAGMGGTPIPTDYVAALDVTLDASADPSSRPAEDLASPLTQTGALIGTPAYMAPEQYMGSDPDPRTDQFAYCVTVWQALTGDRPFKGTTLDELRRAALAGVGNVKADLPKPVRAAIARGLEPDPQKRWPELDSLLDELERVTRKRTSRWPISVGGVTIAAIAITALALRSDPKVKPACEPAERVFDQAWSKKIRDEIARRVPVSEAAFANIAKPLDELRARWVPSYDQVCKAPTSKLFHAKVACLEGVRDQVAAIAHLLRTADKSVFAGFDPYDVMPNLTICNSDAPIAPPAIPDDARRDEIIAVMARTIALHHAPLAELDAGFPKLEAEAKQLAWQPLGPQILVAAASEYVDHGEVARSRELAQRALPMLAESHDTRFEATARMILLADSMIELEHPGWFGDAHPQGKLHEELGRLLAYARSATAAAGNDPMLVGALKLLEARARADVLQWEKPKSAFNDAIALAGEARALFASAGDLHRAAQAAALQSSFYLRRGDSRALDDAVYALRSAEDELGRAGIETPRSFAALRMQIALIRDDLREAHAQWARIETNEQPGLVPFKGRVVWQGKPRRAEVLVWRGELHGDRVFVEAWASSSRGEVATDADATFTIHAEPGWAIMAQDGNLVSRPQVIGSEPIVLELESTKEMAGRFVGQHLLGAKVVARFPAGSATWLLEGTISPSDRRFTLAHLPTGAAEIYATGPMGDGVRILRGNLEGEVTWPFGTPVEVIVRAKSIDDAATVWMTRGKLAPRTRAEAETAAARAQEVITSSLHRIGSDATDQGREYYAPGDRHAVLLGTPDGSEVTICVANGKTPETPVACKTQKIERAGKIYEYADDRYGATPVAIVFEL